jgi:hypothetical protein
VAWPVVLKVTWAPNLERMSCSKRGMGQSGMCRIS